ncbi:MAG: hypothetical protein E7157_04235 [Lactobacillales bacterium]|nr:hypothetical protein [Lactobacillales bacterium]
MIDFDKKMDDIISDYYSTIGKFDNVSNLMSLRNYTINENDDDETKRIKEARKNELLIDLGRVAELAFKYLIKIRRANLFPNEPYSDTIINGNKVKGFKEKETLSAGVIRELGTKAKASNDDINFLINFEGMKPHSHNFYYLYLIIDKFMPDIKDKINEIVGLKLKSDYVDENSDKFYSEALMYFLFPNCEVIKSDIENEGLAEKIRNETQKMKETISYSGDIFTRLRYYANNTFDKSFSVEELYTMVSKIIFFIKIVHFFNEKLDFDPEVAFSYYLLKNDDRICKFDNNITLSDDNIKEIYAHNKYSKNADIIMISLFCTSLSADEIIEIFNSNEINENDCFSILARDLNLETVLYFRSIGINNYDDMDYELIKKSITPEERMLNAVFGQRYTLEEYKVLRERHDANQFPGILDLLYWMSPAEIDELRKYPTSLKFFINEFDFFRANEIYKKNIFKKLLNMSEFDENPDAWYGVNPKKWQIYSNISKLLMKDPLNSGIINNLNFDIDRNLENIKENIKFFKNNKKLLRVMPLMLDFEDNKYILNILINNGLDINNLEEFDSTILCFPVKLVEFIERLFSINNIPLIVDNNVNPLVLNVISLISNNMTKNPVIDNLVCKKTGMDKEELLKGNKKLESLLKNRNVLMDYVNNNSTNFSKK